MTRLLAEHPPLGRVTASLPRHGAQLERVKAKMSSVPSTPCGYLWLFGRWWSLSHIRTAMKPPSPSSLPPRVLCRERGAWGADLPHQTPPVCSTCCWGVLQSGGRC